MSPKIIIHGGFFSESDQDHGTKKAKQDALREIIDQGYQYLQNHTAAETAAYTVSLLEDNPLFNAGIGSQIQSDGKIRMSAALMDSVTQKFSGVINVENIKNPIFLAQKLAVEDDRVLGGEGANRYAEKLGIPFFSTETTQRREEYLAKVKSAGRGTVGCVALDKEGNLAAATSTGGKGFEIPGRISDSATVAGNYANRICAVSCTGVGEDIMSNATAAKIVTRRTDGMTLADAFGKTFAELAEYEGFAGAIAIDFEGNIYHQESFPKIVYASFDGAQYAVFD